MRISIEHLSTDALVTIDGTPPRSLYPHAFEEEKLKRIMILQLRWNVTLTVERKIGTAPTDERYSIRRGFGGKSLQY
jgi:hypothetical protein